MKIAPSDITAFVKRPLKQRAALIYGADEGMVRDYVQSLLQTYKPAEITRLQASTIEQEPPILYDALASLSLFGDQIIVWVEHAQDKLTATIKQTLELPASNPLIISAGELGNRSTLRQLAEKSPELACIACYSDEGGALEQIVQQQLQQHGKTIDKQTLHYMCSLLGNDRGVTRSEVHKLCQYLGEQQQVDADAIDAVICHNKHNGLDDLVQAVFNGQHEAAQHIAERLSKESIPPVAQARALARHAQRLHHVRILMQAGTSAEQAIQSLRPPVFFKQKHSFQQQCQRFSVARLAQLRQMIVQAELAAKRGHMAELHYLHQLQNISLNIR